MAAINSSEIKVYVLQSSYPIFQIEGDLAKTHDGAVYVNAVYRRSPTGKRQATRDKTLLMCTVRTANELLAIDSKYKIEPYNWDSFPNPRRDDGETEDLHVTGVPNTMRLDAATNMINTFLSPLKLPAGSFEIEMSVGSRTTGNVTGFGKIKFTESVSYETRQLCKLILHNREYEDSKFISCTWHNPNIRKNRAARSTTERGTERSSEEVEIRAAEVRKSAGSASSTSTTSYRPVRVKSFRTQGNRVGIAQDKTTNEPVSN
jgi:hypothetical protein